MMFFIVVLFKGEIMTEKVTTESILARYRSPLSGEGGRRAVILEMEAKLLAAEEANRQRLKQVCLINLKLSFTIKIK